MKQQNANHLVQAYATHEKYKQNTDLQAPCLCPITLLIKKPLYLILHYNKVFHTVLSVNSELHIHRFFS